MIAITGWASSQVPLFSIPDSVLKHPWFLATLVDAYWAFLTFFVWVWFKEPTFAARVLWFIAIVLLGNLAMAVYFLRELARIRSADDLPVLFGRRNEGRLPLPSTLAAIGVAIYASAWVSS